MTAYNKQHDHMHRPDCGHTAIKHNAHVDYLVDGDLHHPHHGHCDNHLIAVDKTTYLRPLRDAENELVSKRNSWLSQILLGDPTFKNQNHELVYRFEGLNTNLKKFLK
ncbi:hypothetical protein [Acinetobacter sp. 1125_18A]|uniref:hypothetical protein n=1 Tax=Acinetobacter sp. 1125_18A TaxID=2605959 RepID=UPI004059173F